MTTGWLLYWLLALGAWAVISVMKDKIDVPVDDYKGETMTNCFSNLGGCKAKFIGADFISIDGTVSLMHGEVYDIIVRGPFYPNGQPYLVSWDTGTCRYESLKKLYENWEVI